MLYVVSIQMYQDIKGKEVNLAQEFINKAPGF